MAKPSITPISVGVSDAAKMVGISRSRMYELLNEGTVVKSTMIGHRRVILVSSLKALVGETEQQAA